LALRGVIFDEMAGRVDENPESEAGRLDVMRWVFAKYGRQERAT
jgi:hypothetical protein